VKTGEQTFKMPFATHCYRTE